ncbi:MAG: hypothetical protein GX136_01575 [Clostridiales bacterium]|nr:hypothetical protein [Clostridiales bacterium]
MSGLSVPKKLGCTLFLFCIGGTLYNILEVLWRGYIHWTMFIVGGVCFNLIGRIHTICKKGLLIRCTLCSLAITAVEFVSGCLFNLRLKMNVWNYSNMLLNIKGQVCLLYSVLWGALSIIAIPVYRHCLRRMVSRNRNSVLCRAWENDAA